MDDAEKNYQRRKYILFFTRFFDNFINNFFIRFFFFFCWKLLMNEKRLIHFGFWLIWPLKIGNAEFYRTKIFKQKKNSKKCFRSNVILNWLLLEVIFFFAFLNCIFQVHISLSSQRHTLLVKNFDNNLYILKMEIISIIPSEMEVPS